MYWRALRETATFFEQTGKSKPVVLVVLFLAREWMPEPVPISLTAPSQLLTLALEDCLDAIQLSQGVLTVLKPLVVPDVRTLKKASEGWRRQLEAYSPDPSIRNRLIDLLEYLIFQRFPRLSKEELQAMIHLTPIEETVVGKELIALGEKRGELRGEKRGELRGEKRGEQRGLLIGRIQLAEELLGLPSTPLARLSQLSLARLQSLAQELQQQSLANRTLPKP